MTADYSLSVTANVQTALPDPPGHVFLGLFLSPYRVCVSFRCSVLVLLICALIYQLTNLKVGHFPLVSLTTAHGKAQPIIMLMSNCHTVLALFMSVYKASFLLDNQEALLKCFGDLAALCRTLHPGRTRLQPPLKRLKYCFWFFSSNTVDDFLGNSKFPFWPNCCSGSSSLIC